MSTSVNKKKVGIALSGGGARGIAHLGILQALEEVGIHPQVISGVSAGSIMGAFYAAGYPPLQTMEIVLKHNFFGLTKVLWRKSGVLNMSKLSQVYRQYFIDDSFESLNKKLFITATDILKAESVCISSGNLSQAILASSSVPLLFEPIQLNGYTLLDGGLLNNFPIEPLLEAKCDIVIGAHVNPINTNIQKVHMKDVVDRSFHIALSTSVKAKKNRCDLFIEPSQLFSFGMFDLKKAEAIYQIGYDYAYSLKDELLEIKKRIENEG